MTLSPVWLMRSCRKRIYMLILLWKVYTKKYASCYGFRKVFIFFNFLNGQEERFLVSNTSSDELTVFLICKSLTQILLEPRKKNPNFFWTSVWLLRNLRETVQNMVFNLCFVFFPGFRKLLCLTCITELEI